MRIVVVMDGGIVQGIVSDGPVEVLVKDYDVEGCDAELLHHDKAGKEYYGSMNRLDADSADREAVAAMFTRFEVENARKDTAEACVRAMFDANLPIALTQEERQRIADAMREASRRQA